MKKHKHALRKLKSNETKIVRVKAENSGGNPLRVLIIALVIAVQLALLVYLYVELALAFKSYVIFSLVMSVLTCIYVLSTNKNSLSKAVWIIFLLLGFVFSYTVYFLSDEHIFFSRPKRRLSRIFRESEKYIPENNENIASDNCAEYLYRAGGFHSYLGTDTKYFPSGAQFFDDVLDELKKAEKFVFMEFFIVSDGVLMKRFLDIAAQLLVRGVDIRIIYDDAGSHKSLSRPLLKRLLKIGIKLAPFNRLIPIFSVAMNYRDHRKIIVIDGKVAYTGGVNFSDEYINEKRMYGYWKDSGIKIEGPATDAFTLMFLRQWRYLRDCDGNFDKYFGHAENKESKSLVVPFADGLDYDISISMGAYMNIISEAKEQLYVMTPYFIPGDTVSELIINKALSGVDVRLILPSVPDKKFVYSVSRNNAEKLLEYGVKVYCMKDSFVHSKLIMSERAAVVGSVNMDLRSFYQQFECAVYTTDEGVISSALADFLDTVSECEEITLKTRRRNSIFRRIFNGLMQLFAPFM